MLKPSEFRDLLSGRKQGPAARLLRGFLSLVEYPYAWAVRRRNRDFDSGRRAMARASVPVISVGNLTLGGTGKTPMVQWLARWFSRRGIRVALVSRGYKSAPGSQNDEARELEQTLPGVPHVQNPDRLAASQQAVIEFKCQLILLDDGFQHRRLARNLDIVLLDALEPFGFDHVFPRGTLREPIESLSRAQVAVLTRADLVDESERSRIRGIVRQHAPQITWAECRHAPRTLLACDGKQVPLNSLQGSRIVAFCGIGNPGGFRRTLEQSGCKLIDWREFPDHHLYNRADIDELARWAQLNQATVLLCTHKDLVKLNVAALGDIPLWAVQIELEFVSGQESLETRLEPLAAMAAPRAN